MISNVCNIRYVINNFNYYFFYGLGMLLSFIINIYLINYLFKKYKNITYIFILCLSIFSIIILLINTLKLKCAFCIWQHENESVSALILIIITVDW